MGFLDIFNSQEAPTVPSVLPGAAKQQILCGQLPVLEPNNLFLKKGEICHYADRAIYEKRAVKQRRVHRGGSHSVPGLFEGTRFRVGGGVTDSIDHEQFTTIKGVLYITSKRVIFVSDHDGFNKKLSDLVAATPYSNCIELQFSKDTLKLFVPDGGLVYSVLRLV